MKINKNYYDLTESYLFSTIARKVKAYSDAHPDANITKLGIGDVTLPLAPSVISAMHKAVDDQASAATFHGYGPEQGYEFIKAPIQAYYKRRGVDLDINEIFISDGAKSDIANIMYIMDNDNVVIMPDPVYPAYLDVNIMLGRKVLFTIGNKENGFKPMPDKSVKADIIYICSPNNPTGAVYNKEELKAWVDYALSNKAIILFDAAYEAYVSSDDLPRTIYEVEGAKDCAIEICSLSKTAGFTGTRCGYTIVPKELYNGEMNKFWLRRQTTKFNGTSYVVQCGAAAVFTEQGQKEIKEQVAYYMNNAHIIHEELKKAGIWHVGGENSPYIWLQCPDGMTSWDYFDALLDEGHVVGTPGVGFGAHGEGFFRLTGFGNREKTEEAIKRLVKVRR